MQPSPPPLPPAASGALDLPEILSLLGPHLPRQTLLSCILVSRTWLASFLPFLWHQVLIQGVHSVQANVFLRRHAAHVREVVVWRVSSLKHFSDLERYWRVRSLKVKMGRKEDVGRVVWEKLGGLVAACESGLRDVVVEDCAPLDVFLVALGGRGIGQRKKEYRPLLLQGQLDEQDSSEEEGESEGEYESGQEEEGESGVGTLTATTPTTSTTSVNTTDTATTTVAPLSSPSIVTRKRHYASFSTLSPIEGCRLDTLVWKRIRVAASSMDHLWQASRGARDLTLECLTITGIDKNATTIPTAQTMVLTNDGATTYPSLRPIVTNPPVPNTSSHVLRISWIMGLSVDLQLDLWIRPCQELRSLVWEAPSFPDPLLYRFARCLEDVEGSWSWLTSLEISACVAPFPSDAALARILAASSPSGYSSASSSYSSSPPCSSSSSSSSWSYSSFDSHRSSQENDNNTRQHQQYQQYQHQRYHRWERLVFRTVGFGPLAFEALRRHFGTLKTLKWIGYAGSVTNEMAKEVLESCPLLEDFYAPFLWVSDFGTSAVVEEVQGEAIKGQEQRLQQQQQQQQQDELDQGPLPRFTALSLQATTSSSTVHYPSPPLSPLSPPALVPSSSSNTIQMQPWKCLGLQTLFISATSPNFFSPPPSKDDENIIRTRLATLKELSYYCVGSTVFSSSFRHEY